MQWQLGREMGTIPAFASRTQENQENLGRDGQKTRGTCLNLSFWKQLTCLPVKK